MWYFPIITYYLNHKKQKIPTNCTDRLMIDLVIQLVAIRSSPLSMTGYY